MDAGSSVMLAASKRLPSGSSMPELSTAKQAFRRLLFRSVLVPAAVMVLLALVLIVQVRQLVESTKWVEHTDEVISRLYKAQLTLAEGQSGVRGFLLTADDRDLGPVNFARADLPKQLAELRALTADRPQTVAFADEIVRRFGEWDTIAQEKVAQRIASGTPPLSGTGQAKVIAADISKLFDRWEKQEISLRAERNAQTQTSAAWTVASAGGATIIVGLFLSLLSRGQLRWLSQSYERALARATELSSSLEQRVQERTKELEQTNAKLGDANKELEAFAYSVSHDLRAPMRHISGFANLLRMSETKFTTDDLEYLDTIHRTAVLAGRMVDDLLAFSRIGRSKMRVDPVDLNQVVETVRRELAPELQGRKVEWTLPRLDPIVGDPNLLKLVIQNLLANAIKYSANRELSRIEIGSRAEDGGVTYWVKDNGVGFDMAYAHKLFGVFQRLHRAEEFEGTGIGLANVRRIITRHGGRTWAEGVSGQGATFYFHLPSTPIGDATATLAPASENTITEAVR